MEPDTITIPTELERADEFVVLAAGIGGILVCWWLISVPQVPWPLVMIPMVSVLSWMFTSQAATEIRGVGAVAVWLRGRLGGRSALEWVTVFLRFVWLVKVPVWRSWCERLFTSVLRRASSLRPRQSAKTA